MDQAIPYQDSSCIHALAVERAAVQLVEALRGKGVAGRGPLGPEAVGHGRAQQEAEERE